MQFCEKASRKKEKVEFMAETGLTFAVYWNKLTIGLLQ